MKQNELINYLEENSGSYDFRPGIVEGREGLFVYNRRFETCTHFSHDAINENSLNALLSQTVKGKDVDHITRITGYFTRVSSWNKGKRGELHDRYRSSIN